MSPSVAAPDESPVVAYTFTLDLPGLPAEVPAVGGTGVVAKSTSASFSAAAAANAVPRPPAPADESATEAFYSCAVAALRAAQARLNEDLTAWKDAVGDGEKHKESTKQAGFGKGKANMMMAANRAAEKQDTESDESSDE